MILEKNMGLIGKIEDTKEITRSCKLKKDIQHNGQQEKNKRTNTIYITIHRKLKIEQQKPDVSSCAQFFLKMWHPSCYSSYRPGDKSSMGTGPDCNDENLNVSVVSCDKDTPWRLTKSQWRLHLNH